MRRNIPILILFLLLPVCRVLRGEEAVDAGTLIAHVKERIAFLETLYKQGIRVEMEDVYSVEGSEQSPYPPVTRVVYRGLFELNLRQYISQYRSTPPEEGYDEDLDVRNPKYSFFATKSLGDSGYTVLQLYDDRDGVLTDRQTIGLLDDTVRALVGVYIGDVRLRDLLESKSFKAESAEKREDQYRLAFRCQFPMDQYNQILGGEMFFSAEDYSLEEVNYEGGMLASDRVYPWTRGFKYTYGDWQGVKYPNSWEYRRCFNDKTTQSRTTVRSFQPGVPNKKQFYLKHYGISKLAAPKARSDSPRQLPIHAIFIAVGLILIGLGILLKRRAAAGSKDNTSSAVKNDVHEV